LATDEKVYGPDHRKVATDLNNRAVLLSEQVRATRTSSRILLAPLWMLYMVLMVLNNRAGLLSICSSTWLALTASLFAFLRRIPEKALVPEYADVAQSLNPGAVVERWFLRVCLLDQDFSHSFVASQGKHETELLLKRSLAINEMALGPHVYHAL
ncbi:unnamed protein product, partial [Ectocarpus sp. 8 AP-2014]